MSERDGTDPRRVERLRKTRAAESAVTEGAAVQTFYVVKDEGDGDLAYWHFDTEAEARAHPYAQDEDAVVIAIPSAEEGAAGTVRGNSENLSVKPGGFFDKRLADHEAAEEGAAG